MNEKFHYPSGHDPCSFLFVNHILTEHIGPKFSFESTHGCISFHRKASYLDVHYAVT